MDRSRKLRLAAAALGFGTLIATAAWALPYPRDNQQVSLIYFSDASHAGVVGGYSYGNCWDSERWGEQTRYFSISYAYCNRDPY